MNENEFIVLLQKRAQEQEALISRIPLPGVFLRVIAWLGKHPWRLLIPLAFVISVFLHILFGSVYTNLILQIFRWL